MNEFEENNVKKVNILVAALPKSISEDYLDLAKTMGLNPYYLDIHSNAIYKLLSSKPIINDSYLLEDQTIAVIDLGHRFINVIIINKGQFEFSRLLNHGGKDIDINIADLYNFSLKEAETKKKEIKNVNYDYYINQGISTMLIDVVKETIADWLEEIRRIFMYYTSRNVSNVIDSICIYGGCSNIEGITTYIQEFFNIPTFKINNLNNAKFNNNLERISISSYVNAIGAIIRR